MTSVDCYNTSRLIEQLINRFDLPTSNGFPILNDNLQWDQPDFSVVGALAALGVGPDAANLMGISRAAEEFLRVSMIMTSMVNSVIKEDRVSEAF
eukprot:CAMPEP_0197295168 /NCGR_PEP_ID=MMETSP0890-20130614/34774_1 /TAXON_ID=44058 ORGANISM="Aureoumbra lagunensis, Strain CCMP1510" /NCGR_SAMPLE_ID=MMETSP0890 /ASSEMBLY_ACC=CAM_ASM_000533 /LENGTH=94 /DNA_ID=CAMNT_0042770989 /DNA_START=673 /DNA_END=958 /DNA_ORIENTATION=+